MAEERCAVCGSACVEAHSMSVLVEGYGKRGHLGVRCSKPICAQCNALLTYDPWGDSNYRIGAEEDRLILKVLSGTLLDIAIDGLRTLREEPHAIPA